MFLFFVLVFRVSWNVLKWFVMVLLVWFCMVLRSTGTSANLSSAIKERTVEIKPLECCNVVHHGNQVQKNN